METRILNNLVVQGSLVMADNLTDFPPNPAIGTFVVKDQCLYGYIKIGGLTTWYPFASKTNSYIHSQGIASTQWIIQHNLGTTNVWTQVKDTQGRIIQALVEPVDENTLRVTFTEAVAGTAVIVAPDSINVPQVEASLIDVGSGKVIIDTSGIRIDGEYVLTSGNIQFYAEQAVADEAAIRAAADTTLQSNINAEVLARQSGDSDLQGQIDAYLDQAVKTTSTPSFSGVNLSGHVIPSTNELYDLGSATNRFRDLYLSGSTIYVGDGQLSYDSVLKTFNFVTPTQEAAAVNLSANSTDDLVEGTTNLYYTNARAQAIVDAEATARAAADVTLQSNIDAEATARAGADTTIISSLTAESDARQAADATLQLNIEAVSTAVAALGNAFNYVGVVSGGGELTPTDLATLPASGKDAGDYYKVSVSGWFKVGTGSSFFANAGDGLVWNTLGDVDKIDNTNSSVAGTAGYVSVSGSSDTGFVVDLDSGFKSRVSNVESGIATEITARVAADDTITSNLAAEITARQAADATLQSAINTKQDALLHGAIASAALTTSTTGANQVVDQFSVTSYRASKYVVQVTSGTAYQATELLVVHNGSSAFITEYANLLTGANLAVFDADVSGGTVRLLVTPVNAATTIKLIRQAVAV